MLAGAPGLSRAVADCTHGSFPTGDVFRGLQKYLSDEKSADAVYKALIQRAWTDPQSAAVVDRVIAIFKQFLLRYTPSMEVLALIEDFCDGVPDAINLQPSGLQAVQYVKSCVRKLRRQDGATPVSLSRPPSMTSTRLGHVHRDSADGPNSVMLSSLSRVALSEAVPHDQDGMMTDEDGSGAGLGRGNSHQLPDSMLDGAAEQLYIPALQAGEVPAWALQWSTGLRAALQSTEMHDKSYSPWLLKVPDLNPNLSAATSSLHPITMSTVIKCVLDVEEAEVPKHLQEVSEALRAEVQTGKMHAELQQSSSKRSHAHALFHHQPYNNQESLLMQEADVAAVVEVVCGPQAAASTFSRNGSMFAADDGSATVLRDDGTGWQALFHTDNLGQICSTILIKLIMDMFLRIGPGNAYPLVLRMLRKALNAADPTVRARAFDVLYNLSLHAAMLQNNQGDAEMPTHSAAAGMPLAGSAEADAASSRQIHAPQDAASTSSSDTSPADDSASTMQPLQQQQQQEAADAQHGSSASANGKAHGGLAVQQQQQQHHHQQQPQGRTAAPPDHVRFKRWVRALLFQLLCALTELDERVELVWQSALGCLLQLTTHGDYWVTAWVEFLPLQGLAGLLRACVAFNWSPELHCHLLRLASHLLIISEERDEATAAAPPPRDPAFQPSTSGGSHLFGQTDIVIGRNVGGGVAPSFGGLSELLYHYTHAPTTACRVDLLAVMVHCLSPNASAARRVATMLQGLHVGMLSLILQSMLRCPQHGSAVRLVQALHDSCPETVKDPELLLDFLARLEDCAMLPWRSAAAAQLGAHIQATINHINAAAAGTAEVDAQAVLAAWQAFKDLSCCPDAEQRQLAVHWLHQVLLQAFHVCQAQPLLLSPLNLKTAEATKFAAHAAQSAAGLWNAQLADALLHVVRGVPDGNELLLSAVLRALSDLKQSNPDATVVARNVMLAFYITLLWMLQSGDSSEAFNLSCIQSLADHVLSAITQPSQTLPGSSRATEGPAHDCQHIASAILSGDMAFTPDVLQNTPPELLVSLLQQCSQQHSSATDMYRGFKGRPADLPSSSGSSSSKTWHGSGRSSPGPSVLGTRNGSGNSSSSGSSGPQWHDIVLDRRLALLLALMARCALDPEAFAKHSLAHLMKGQLASEDVRERYYAGVYLLKHWMLNQQDKYWRTLRQLIIQAQQLNDERLLDNPYLQICTMLTVDHAA